METNNKDINLMAASGRAKGVANFAVNFEPGGQSPLDARLLVKTKADLINPETYAAKNYYKGMPVTVEADGTEYVLMDVSKITSSDYSGWKQRDSMDTSNSLPSTIITDLTNVTVTATTAVIHSSKVTKSGRTYGSAADDNVTIPAATTSAAGVMSADDKTELDRITTANFALGSVTPSATTITIAASKTNIDSNSSVANNITLPAVTSSSAGIMAAADKVKLDTTIPNYTVNSLKISTNPVITGANAKVTGYTKPTETGAIAETDSINGALGKLEKKEDDHIANKSNPHGVTKAQVGLGNCDNTSDVNKPISTATQNALNTKVQTVEVTGTGNAITAASISGTKLTLTKGATYNNQTYTFANGSDGSFTVTPSGGSAQKVTIGKPSTAGTADTAKACSGNSATASKVNNNLVLKVNSGTTEGTSLYTFNGSAGKTLDIKAGSNVSLSTAAGVLTINSSYTNTTYSAGKNISLSGTTFALADTISLTRVNASGGFFQTSDKRLKSDIKPLDHSLEDICSIPTDSFILNGKEDLGTIAQEVEEKFPELVSETTLKESEVEKPEDFEKVEVNGESYVLVKEVDYAKLSVLAIEGIKLLKQEIEELKKQLNK